MESFGGKQPYRLDFEIAEELSPDPFSEEPMQTLRHIGRASMRAERLKKRSRAAAHFERGKAAAKEKD
mgnify:CR=1 FL=1